MSFTELTAEEYAREMEALTGRRERQLAEAQNVGRQVERRAVEQAIRAAVVASPSAEPRAADDIAAELADLVKMDESGNVIVFDSLGKRRGISVGDLVEEYTSTRPHLKRAQVAKGSTVAAAAPRKPNRNMAEAIKDPALMDAWKSEDPAGWKAAWAAHLAAEDARLNGPKPPDATAQGSRTVVPEPSWHKLGVPKMIIG